MLTPHTVYNSDLCDSTIKLEMKWVKYNDGSRWLKLNKYNSQYKLLIFKPLLLDFDAGKNNLESGFEAKDCKDESILSIIHQNCVTSICYTRKQRIFSLLYQILVVYISC
jgi:hypothetical protein